MADISAIQAGTVQSNDLNNPSVRVYKGKNQFPQSFQHPSTCSYAYVDPVAFAKCEPGDVYPYKFVTDLNTFTLKSPMKSKVKMYSAAFKVPMKAIYPRNFELMFVTPNKGDDVPEDTRANLLISVLYNRLLSVVGGSSLDDALKAIFILESIFSDGGIFAKANIHLCDFRFAYRDSDGDTVGALVFDQYFDQILCPWLRQYLEADDSVRLSYYDPDELNIKYVVTFDNTKVGLRYSEDTFYISFARAIELLRTGEYDFNRLIPEGLPFPRLFTSLGYGQQSLPDVLNIEPILAYQLSCVQFFNNPKIDYIYNVDLWRDNLESFCLNSPELGFTPTFEYNGILKYYDVLSGRFMTNMLGDTSNDGFLQYFLSLFSFQRSLRYGDYFTGAHTEPIAPGDIDMEPNADGSVNSLEAVRKLQLTRYLNKCNISGPRMGDYLKIVFGESMPGTPDDIPIRLSREEFDVGGFEVNNTGSAQLDDNEENITTTNLRLDSNRFMFEVHISEPCWLVMVQYFEAHRIYSKTIDRFAFHFDRFDDFIPDMQFTGDQEVYSSELSGLQAGSVPFAYNLRHMEYKQRYSYASGGFIRRLKSWAFVTDNTDGNPATGHITPDYIRSSPTEFDRFYKSLTGYSLGSRFHFITFNTNVAAPYRQMVYAPEILA